MQRNENLVFHLTDNPQIIAYSKTAYSKTAYSKIASGKATTAYGKAIDDAVDVVLTIVNLDPVNTQAGFVMLDLAALGVKDGASFEVFDLLANRGYRWQGSRNYVELRPYDVPAHVFEVRK